MNNDYIEHNGSGYVDTTVDAVIKDENKHRDRERRLVKENYEYKKMCREIKGILSSKGYVLEGPISLINLESGRKRRIY